MLFNWFLIWTLCLPLKINIHFTIAGLIFVFLLRESFSSLEAELYDEVSIYIAFFVFVTSWENSSYAEHRETFDFKHH